VESKPLDVRTLLAHMVESGASDLYLTVDSPPMLRIEGVTEPIGSEPLKPANVEALANSLMSERQRLTFDEKLEMNLAIASERSGRFRTRWRSRATRW